MERCSNLRSQEYRGAPSIDGRRKVHDFPETELKVASCNGVSTRIEVGISSELHLMPVFENLGSFFRASQSTLGDASYTGVLLARLYIYRLPGS